MADDSGIEAAALRGAPGVWSARYAGEGASDEENLAKLLSEVPADGDRRVAYVCALAYVEPGGREEIVHGRCEGQLALEPRGEGGFGYDPAFVPDDYPGDERTMAELTPYGEGRDQPSRPRGARAGGAAAEGGGGRAAGQLAALAPRWTWASAAAGDGTR